MHHCLRNAGNAALGRSQLGASLNWADLHRAFRAKPLGGDEITVNSLIFSNVSGQNIKLRLQTEAHVVRKTAQNKICRESNGLNEFSGGIAIIFNSLCED